MCGCSWDGQLGTGSRGYCLYPSLVTHFSDPDDPQHQHAARADDAIVHEEEEEYAAALSEGRGGGSLGMMKNGSRRDECAAKTEIDARVGEEIKGEIGRAFRWRLARLRSVNAENWRCWGSEAAMPAAVATGR